MQTGPTRPTSHQGVTRSLSQLVGRERELLSSNLIFRDKNKNFFLSISCFGRERKIKIEKILTRIILFARLLTNIFNNKKLLISQNKFDIMFFSFLLIWIKIPSSWTRTKKLKIISQCRTRKNEADYRGNSQELEFLSLSEAHQTNGVHQTHRANQTHQIHGAHQTNVAN